MAKAEPDSASSAAELPTERRALRRGYLLHRLRPWLPRLRDLVWPMVESPSAEKVARETSKASERSAVENALVVQLEHREDVEEIEKAVAAIEKLVDVENQSRLSIEARLTSVLGMTSIAAALVVALLSGQIAGLWTRSLLSLAFACLALAQLLCALRAAVGGLGRRDFQKLTATAVLYRAGEAKKARLARLASELLACLRVAEQQNCRKVEHMAVAHEALRNFFIYLVLLALAAVVAGGRRTMEDPLVERLRKDAALLYLLRGTSGPQGAKGDRGQPAPQGPTGPKGDAGPPSVPAPASQPPKATPVP